MFKTPSGLAILATLALLGCAPEGPIGAAAESDATAQMMSGMHDATLDALCPLTTVTHTANPVGGDWFATSTWASGTIPGAGAIVHIPMGSTVTYDGSGPNDEGLIPLFMVRVDGTLAFTATSATTATQIVFDTLLVRSTGELNIDADDGNSGTVDLEIRPWDVTVATDPFYTDVPNPKNFAGKVDGAGVLGRHGWDPSQLSLGIVAHGPSTLLGQEKAPRIRLASQSATNQITLDSAPTGWNVDDEIVVTSTHYKLRTTTGKTLGSEDEVRTITAVSGSTVTLDAPLTYSHDDAPNADLSAYVVNLTRNVRIHSAESIPNENPLDADVFNDIATRLGHVMFMHTSEVEVRNVLFDDMGRTNKNRALDDFSRNGGKLGSNRHTPEAKSPADEIKNQRGRYAVHLHLAGAGEDDGTAVIEGSVVTGGAGWGFVSHGSRADFIDNVTYGVLGAGFVAESGNETGVWDGNTAIYTYGAEFTEWRFGIDDKTRYEIPEGEEHYSTDGTMILDKRGAWKNQDLAHFGHGFWFQGKLIEITNNVSVSSGLTGYFFMFRGPDQELVDRNVLEVPLSVHNPDGISPLAPGLNVFVGNESIADSRGIDMIGTGGGRTNDERSIIRDFVAWEVGDVGTAAQYYPGYTIRDSTFIASSTPNARAGEGVLMRQVQVDVVLANLTIEGFAQQYELRKQWSDGTFTQHGYRNPYDEIDDAAADGEPNPLPLGYAQIVIDPDFPIADAANPENLGEGGYDPNYDQVLSSSDLVEGRFNIAFDDSSLVVDIDLEDSPEHNFGATGDPIRPTLQEGLVLMLRGTKTDSIGPIPIEYHNNVLVWHPEGVQARLEADGYYEMADGRLGVQLEELFSDRYSGDRHLISFIAELDPDWDLTGLENNGTFVPAAHPNVYVPSFLQLATDARRIAAGSVNGFVDSEGNTWEADTGATGGTMYYNDTAPIDGTVDDEIYYGKRSGNTSYALDVTPGTYDVIFHFVDPKANMTVGSRVFDVDVEGALALDDYDIAAELGPLAAAYTAATATVENIDLSDGTLNVDFTQVSGKPATVSGIEIVPTSGQPARRIAVGGGAFIDTDGKTWEADNGATGGTMHYNDTQSIGNTDNDEIHYGKRAGGSFDYELAVSPGTYEVTFHFVDPKSDMGPGTRVMDVDVEGSLALDDYDIAVALGAQAGPYAAVSETVTVDVLDGMLDVSLTSVAGRPATLSGIEITPVP